MSQLETIIRGFLGALSLSGKYLYIHSSKNTNLLAQFIPELQETAEETSKRFYSLELEKILYKMHQAGYIIWENINKDIKYMHLRFSRNHAKKMLHKSKDLEKINNLYIQYINQNS